MTIIDLLAGETLVLLTKAGYPTAVVRIFGRVCPDLHFEGYVWATVPPHPSHPATYYEEFTRAAVTAFHWTLESHQIQYSAPLA